MATRDDIVRIALAEDGYHDGAGYDELTKYTELYLGAVDPSPAWCDIFVSWVFHQAGVPLPKMGDWISEGSQYCPQSWAYAVSRGATRNSWEAEPGDQAIFDWTGTGNLGPESHTAIVQFWDAGTGWLYFVGGNQGPSNVDGFRGAGGVHRGAMYCPTGVGNNQVMGVIDTSKLVKFSTVEDEFILNAEDKAYFEDFKKAIITVVEGGLDPKKNPYAIEGFRDVVEKQTATDAKVSTLNANVAKVAAHLGVTL